MREIILLYYKKEKILFLQKQEVNMQFKLKNKE